MFKKTNKRNPIRDYFEKVEGDASKASSKAYKKPFSLRSSIY